MEEKRENNWDYLSEKLDVQNTKQVIYDNLLFNFCGNIFNKKILDFGCGSGEISLRAKKSGAHVKAYDLSESMRNLTAKKIGRTNVYKSIKEIPIKAYDIVFSSLVICITDKKQVKEIVSKLYFSLINNGVAYVGFCNPLSYSIPNSHLQKRFISGNPYSLEHDYKKFIKEGNFEIIEKHRPVGFYERVFLSNGFIIEDVKLSKDYDFIIYKLKKESMKISKYLRRVL